MGRQTAVELAKKGWKVAILDYNETIGRQTAEEIGGSFYKVDVRSWKEQFDAFEQVLASYGRVDFGMFTLATNRTRCLLTNGVSSLRKCRETGCFRPFRRGCTHTNC
jgi:NAD(P)-dependent dehydrogenase (short-subunit alcohol dehydrogenase family)